MGCALALALLEDMAPGRPLARFHLDGTVIRSDHHCQCTGTGGFRGFDHMRKQRIAADHVQDFRHPRTHARAFAGGEDDRKALSLRHSRSAHAGAGFKPHPHSRDGARAKERPLIPPVPSDQSGIRGILLIFSMIRPFEEPMAIEQAPPQHDGRVARGRRRDIQTFLWLCGWGGATALALIVFAVASQTKTATERLRQIFALNEPSAVAELPPRIAQLEVQTQFLTEQLRALATDRDRLTGRIALLESSLDDMTGVKKKQKAATDVLTAKTAALTANAPATPPALQ